ncbi:MAG: hypothetical protein QOF45_1973, partial [Gaiellaceae bacterium]|nr:hypothetical protein [Gaiellaceae bacterium]
MRRHPLLHACRATLPTLLLASLAAACLAGSSRAAAAPAAVSGLVGAYSFDATSGTSVADSSGSGNTGTLSGPVWTAGKTGNALSFDGINDWVTIADAASLDLTSGMTLEAWVKPTAKDDIWRTVVTKETRGNLTYGLFSNSDTRQPVGISTIGSSALQSIVRGTGPTAAGAWTHLATTYNGATLRLYANGAQVASQAVTGAMANSAGALRIGGNAIWAEWFSGQIDDLRIYNKALTAAQVKTDMNTPVAPSAPADTQAPTAPGGLVASAQAQTQITLSWTASTDNVGVTGYSRYQAGTLISSGTGTSFTFTGLTCGTSYMLAVDAYDAAGNRSTRPSLSASTSACTPPPPDTQAPTAPGGLIAGGQTQTQITVSWNASTDNVGVTGYSRYRAGALISSGTGTSFTFTGLTCGTSYVLAVDAYDAAGNRSTRPSLAAATQPCATPPVAAYSFDAGSGTSLTDNSGNGNTGAISGATWTTAGKSGRALTFDGVSDLVTVADKASLDLTTGMTLEAWIRPTANSVWRTVVTKETSGNLTYGLFSNSDVPQPSSIVTIGASAVQDVTTGTTEVPLSSWAHLATTYDGSVLRLYVNGTQVATKNVTGAMASSTGPLQIGGNNVWSEWFQGQIDDLRIYDRALSPSELQTDMNNPVAPPPAADTQVPTAPAGLAASGQTQTQATLSWNASSDNVGVAGYSYYRDGILIGNGTATSYTFTGLACGTSYTLAVEAYDAAGNRSVRPSVNASTSACPPPPPADTQAPTAPAGLVASGQTQTQITLSWNASTDDVGVTGYSRYRAGTLISSGTGTSFAFTGLACGTSYTLAVDAYDAAGNRSTRPSVTASTTACASGGSASVYLSTGGSDSNACTQAAPCKSFDRAYRVAAPGATVEVAAGSYPAQTIA